MSKCTAAMTVLLRYYEAQQKTKNIPFTLPFPIFTISRNSISSSQSPLTLPIKLTSRVVRMGGLLKIHPSELKFPVELKKLSSCSMQLTNKTDKYVAFKVKTTNPKKYCVRPNVGIVLPGATCNVTVTMQSLKEMPPDMQCKDKFLVQSVFAPEVITAKDMTPEMFKKGEEKVVEEFKLRVVYILANPPSPIPEGSDEGSSPRASASESGNENSLLFDPVSRSLQEHNEKSSEAWSMVSELTEEIHNVILQNEKLQKELDLMKTEINKNQARSLSLLFVALVGLVGILVGYFVNST